MSRDDLPVLAADDVHKRFGRRHVLTGVTLSAYAGQLVALVGENGSGKSTLLRILAGVERLDRGRVTLRARVGYCPQEPLLYPYLTPREHFDLFGCGYGLDPKTVRARSAALMDRFAFTSYETCPVYELSGGTRQKLNLAIALLHDPPLLLLDEPFTGFDIETYHRFVEFTDEARRVGTCIVLVTHLLFERERFDSISHLRAGTIHAASS